MTPEERKSLAEQITTNPLYEDTLSRIERDATEAMIYAPDDDARRDAAYRVQAIRSFRRDLTKSLAGTRERKAAPA